ncbi:MULTISPECIES: hypothetical protein [Photobacterium]|uniref:Aromatic ring-opening dioxygenase LigA n=1 Tax=Photobacterium halotolerans TaxID=265726 RepID=A0A0F5VD15_9GAMM|nr:MULTISPECIES: hypothetical protein [Photobacterium]KKC99676.1 aromatic ring-opening dioxygenase LigA [Photobacterium halotolerans]UIP29981.1 hypothetical protein LN341_20720 [Photobacterium sp. TLY01]
MSQSQINLNFINRSNDVNNSEVVIFQKNVAESFDEIAIAWRVIQNCGRNDNHPFVYPLKFEVCASDSFGNYTPQMTAYDGQAYEMVKDTSGDVLRLASSPAVSQQEVEVRNNLSSGSINANIYRDGKLLAAKTNVSPGQKGVFQFHPSIFVGVVSQVIEGEVMNSAIIQQVNTEINLFGIQSADLVMTGGGSGPTASPFEFHLENINK